MFKSQAQKTFLQKNHPTIAKEFAAKTPTNKHLPKYVPNSTHEPIKMLIRGMQGKKR